ncbi:hypothetical protein [Absidia glauca]|uniref:Uncharacterized protein n=1 Tax=Absidia glauca TaxID=4829 RepID=A0A163K7R8_ABSGL|nr:hypothetical protein [Absidia glauca]
MSNQPKEVQSSSTTTNPTLPGLTHPGNSDLTGINSPAQPSKPDTCPNSRDATDITFTRQTAPILGGKRADDPNPQ